MYKFLSWDILQFILYDKQAILNEIQAYQEHIDSLIYLINILYINIAHSMSFLAWFMQNSSSIHVIKADHLIIYFCDCKWLSLVMNDNTDLSDESIKIFEDSSDASYSDDLTTHWSSEEYFFVFLTVQSIDELFDRIWLWSLQLKLSCWLLHMSASKLCDDNNFLDN